MMDEDIIAEVLDGSRHHIRGCTLGDFLSSCDEAVAETYKALLARDDVRGAAVARSINRRFGLKFDPKTVQRHRRGDCTCE